MTTPDKLLLAWMGKTDVRAASNDDPNDIGPVARALAALPAGELWLLDDMDNAETAGYEAWLRGRFVAWPIRRIPVALRGATQLDSILETVEKVLRETREQQKQPIFLVSSGTPAMQAVWVVLAAKYRAELLESSREHGVLPVKLPFKLNVYTFSEAEREYYERSGSFTALSEAELSEEERLLQESPVMQPVLEQLKKIAMTDLPVLIYGETGTGKEVFAKLVYQYSRRRDKPYQIVNCAELADTLAESELFGHEKGAFTGAAAQRKGLFETVGDGTFFLDEIGEMPLAQQAKLLRVLENKTLRRVGICRKRRWNACTVTIGRAMFGS